MATTNASISIDSPDIIPGSLMNYYKATTLHKAGKCEGLTQIQSGSAGYTSTSTVELLDESVVTEDGANKLWVKNMSTDTTEYFTIYIQSEELGRLYAQDWMFIPWSGGSSNNIQVAPSVASAMKLEYVLVYE